MIQQTPSTIIRSIGFDTYNEFLAIFKMCFDENY